MEFTWKTHRYTWVADPLPPESWETGSYVGSELVDKALSREPGKSVLAEELARTCGLALGVVRDRLETLVLEGKVRVEEADYPSEAVAPQILREHFSEALRRLRRADFYIRAAQKAHVEAHHGGELPLDPNGGWSCEICRDLVAHSDETMHLENVLRAGETEAASHFVTAVYREGAEE